MKKYDKLQNDTKQYFAEVISLIEKRRGAVLQELESAFQSQSMICPAVYFSFFVVIFIIMQCYKPRTKRMIARQQLQGEGKH